MRGGGGESLNDLPLQGKQWIRRIQLVARSGEFVEWAAACPAHSLPDSGRFNGPSALRGTQSMVVRPRHQCGAILCRLVATRALIPQECVVFRAGKNNGEVPLLFP
jgi:hypothetical protein